MRQLACRGIAVERWIGLSSAGSFPLLVSDAEAALLEECGPARRLWERLLIVTWGDVADATSTCAIDERVQRFQRYSVTHAELLAEILEVAPLTARKARRIVERLGVIVDDFAALFHEHTEDTAAVHAVYGALRDAVVDALRGDDDELQPAETMRLVQMFEEPQTIDEVRTLHGLKRYLHRQGLRLAFRLFQSGAANRTVDLVVATPERILSVCDRIRFIDFDPERAADDPRLPLPVALIVEAFGRQLLHGHTPPPRIEVLIYGNEVHV